MMNPTTAGLLRIASTLAATLLVGLPAVWGAAALWYQLPGGQILKAAVVLLWSALSVGLLIAVWQGRLLFGVLIFLPAFAGLLIWWSQLRPSNDEIWADDVAQMTTGRVQGNQVTLYNVRNFDWRTETSYTPRWETRSYDLEQLRSVDMIMSYWSMRAIAHMLISFGFEDGRHVVFSVEIRRQKSQQFSEIGGFFKEFELSIVAADERDVIRVRTNIRGEDDYLYQLQMPVAAMRSLFLAYVEEANELAKSPRYYNTVTVNCTTLVYQMMNRIVGHLPLDYRLLLSGYLPEYVYQVHGLNRHYSIEQLRALGRITVRAKQADRSADFSAAIRQGLPGTDTPGTAAPGIATPGVVAPGVVTPGVAHSD